MAMKRSRELHRGELVVPFTRANDVNGRKTAGGHFGLVRVRAEGGEGTVSVVHVTFHGWGRHGKLVGLR